MSQLTLNDMKQLTSDQYEAARNKAIELVKARIGDRPTRADFQRDLGNLATPLDWIALVVFVAALLISSLHIIQFMKGEAATSYDMASTAAGIQISEDAYTIIHELGAILLAEAAAILFMTMHNISAPSRQRRPSWSRWFSVSLLLAVVASIFVFVANLNSGVTLLVSIMPPLFTLGIALRLEQIIVASLQRRDDINHRYLEALAQYEIASADETKHPEFQRIFKQCIWERLLALSVNKKFIDAPAAFKAAAVRREMMRDSWTDAQEEVQSFNADAPLSLVNKTSGNTAHEPDVLASMPMTAHANAHGGIVTAQN